MTSLRLRLLAQTLPFLLVLPCTALAQAGPPTRVEAEAALRPAPVAAYYSPQQIDQLVAPIALYPDELLMQVLMAATYPDQLIDAAQWLQDPANAALRGDDLAAALDPLPWDPSVKALVPFPQVVAMLAGHIDWTQTLGVAFATQQPLVMSRIQHLRYLAMRSGRLRHFRHLAYRQEGGSILIYSAQPDEVYVPIYNPVVVYGSYWPAPEYPPVYIPPPPDFVGETVAPGIEVSVGLGIVGRLWGWSRPDWRRHHIRIDRTEYQRITRNAPVGPGNTWRHRGAVQLASPAAAARVAPPTTAAAPPGTVAPAHAAAVTALPQRATKQPTLIHPAPAVAHPPAAAVVHPTPAPRPPAPAVQPAPAVAHPAPAVVHPAPSVVHPAPAPRPAPAVVHPAPSVVHPAPAPRPAPAVVHPAPSVVHPAPAPRPAPAIVHPAPSVAHPAPAPRPAPAVVHPAPSVVHPAPAPRPAPAIVHPAPSVVHPAPAPRPAPAIVHPAPPVVHPAPAPRPAPAIVHPAPPVVHPAPAPRPAPAVVHPAPAAHPPVPAHPAPKKPEEKKD